ncbi:universal stress protein [Streptomyces sp. CB01881]|uniref:universal stress protein n=1 Tax=Streptomyces sp. CB01881 TaxID=2078691 RepID=UPI000CDC1FEA|nr:universal stress protein [Streptomyces sp. CB01881]AUY53192.1 universal stress protein [Streptomyces sp. CB01881]TYC69350.1 universal stress protein [Streptomyces sp. CB01881]
MTPPVLVGVDGSSESTAAAHWAAEEAVRRGAPLRLVHAWPWLTDGRSAFVEEDSPPAVARRMLADTAAAVRDRHPGLSVNTDVVLDAAVDGLVSAAGNAGLLVLGSRGLGGFAELLVGSVSMATAARSAAPVVLVRPVRERPEAAPGEPGEVLVGIDTQDPDDSVLAFAFREAGLRGARLRAVHGWDLPPAFATVGFIPSQADLGEIEALEAKGLALALAGWRERHPETEVVEEVRLGAARALVEASATADLVVVGRRRRPHDLGPRLGRVAHAVIHHAYAPVAVVPHD